MITDTSGVCLHAYHSTSLTKLKGPGGVVSGIQQIHTLGSLALPFLPYRDKREQHEIHSVRYRLGDIQAHVARFLEYAVSYAAVGLGDRCVGVVVYELKAGEARFGGVLSTYHNFRACAFGFPPILGVLDMHRPTIA